MTAAAQIFDIGSWQSKKPARSASYEFDPPPTNNEDALADTDSMLIRAQNAMDDFASTQRDFLENVLRSHSFLLPSLPNDDIKTLFEIQKSLVAANFRSLFDASEDTNKAGFVDLNDLFYLGDNSNDLSNNEEIYSELYTHYDKEACDAGKHEFCQFLGANPFLIPILEEAKTAIAKYFAGHTTRLEVVKDPDSTDGIMAVVFLTTDFDNAIKLLKEFDEGWWLNNIGHARGKLSFNIDFE